MRAFVEHKRNPQDVKETFTNITKLIYEDLILSIDNERVISGSMEHLTTYVIFQSPEEISLTEAFVLTYRQFGAEVGDIMSYVRTVSEKAHETPGIAEIMEPRIIHFLRAWIYAAYYTDFKKPSKIEDVLAFVDNYSTGYINQIKLAFIRAQAIYKLSKSQKTYELDKTENPDRKRSDILDIKASTLAEQLTLKESILFRRIKASELLKLSWKTGKSKNVIKMIQRSNAVSYWVVGEICICNELRKRVTVLKKFINVAMKCYHVNNFNTTMEIVGGLNNVAIQRLKKTWGSLPERYRGMWAELSRAMDNCNNYGEYRNNLQNAKKQNLPAVPFLGVFLRDLTFIEDGNPDKINELVNFEKIKLMGSIIQEVKSFQSTKYTFKKNEAVSRFLSKSLTAPPSDCEDDTMYTLSVVVEPKTNSTIM